MVSMKHPKIIVEKPFTMASSTDKNNSTHQSLFGRILQTMKLRINSNNTEITNTEDKFELERLHANENSPKIYDLYPENEDFVYDVNISYHEHQLEWVEQVLLPVLEGDLRLTCFLLDRDRIPGVPTTHTIIEAVRSSRKTIVCFSRDYIASSWKQYEVFLAHHLDPGGEMKRILPIIVEECSLPLKYQTFFALRWSDCQPGDVTTVTDKLRRRFFASGILKSFGVEDNKMLRSIQDKYLKMEISSCKKPSFRWDNNNSSTNKRNCDVTSPPHKIQT